MKLSSLVAAGVTVAAVSGASAETFVPSIFSDHMVVQQNKPFFVFGKDLPGQEVKVVFADRHATTKASADGRWRVEISPPPAGGPYQVTIEGSSVKQINDVLVGEVWLCSGQSNMQWSLAGTMNAEAEVAAANYPQIRVYNVPNVRSNREEDDVSARWQVCTPDSARRFSAVGYFFGRHLHQELKVPVGLINSSWGGTHAEAWTPREDLIKLPGMRAQLEGNDDAKNSLWRKHGEELAKWMAGQGVANDAGDKISVASPDFDDSSWSTINLPVMWQRAGIPGNGIMWFRRTLEIPAEVDLSAAATIEFAGIDDLDVTFVNGQPVGRTDGDVPSFWSAPRRYQVPAGLLKNGTNTIAVRVIDLGGDGGFRGEGNTMRLVVGNQQISLTGQWKYQWEQQLSFNSAGRPAMPPGDIMATELYNAMIHPFRGFSIAGTIWYQGESNVGKTAAYLDLLPTMIDSWRRRWEDNFTFLIVQLAGYQADTGRPQDSPAWAQFRDVQRQIAEKVPNAGLAVAIDIGDKHDIHPRNKQDVGRRLALQALKITYGHDIVASGPTIASATADGAKVVLRFNNVSDALVARDGTLANNFAVQDKSGTWVWADAQIAGDTVVLSSPEITTPVKVRYAWQNTPPASLYNSANLPAVPFEIEVK